MGEGEGSEKQFVYMSLTILRLVQTDAHNDTGGWKAVVRVDTTRDNAK